MSAEVPTMEAFLMVTQKVAEMQAKLDTMGIELTDQEKAAIETIINLIKRIVTT